MKQKMKKMMTLGLAVTMAAATLAGCGGSNAPSGETASGSTQAAGGEKVLKFGFRQFLSWLSG